MAAAMTAWQEAARSKAADQVITFGTRRLQR